MVAVLASEMELVRPDLARDHEEAIALEEAGRWERDSLQLELKEWEAYFAQSEILTFVQSRRYEFTPLNVARAMAGLPIVTARASIMNCIKHGIDPSPGMAFNIFQIIERVFRREIIDVSNSINSLRDFLLKRHEDPPSHITELRKNWYFVESAIKFAARNTRVSLDSLPFAAFAEYTRMISLQSAADSVLAHAHRLVVPGEYLKPQSGPDWGPPRKHRRKDAK